MGWSELTAGLQRVALTTFKLDDVVLYHPPGPAPAYELGAIFRDAHEAVSVTDGAAVSSVAPRLGVLRADMQDVPHVDDEVDVPASVVHPAGRYQVKDWLPDGEGMYELVLQKVSE